MTERETLGAVASPIGLPRRTGVVGGGRMGAGIAHALLLAGSDVVVVERDESAAATARDRVERAIAESARRGQMEGLVKAKARLQVATDMEAFAESDLVIEAVPEELELKLATLSALETVLTTDAVIGTNTSISLDTLGDAMAHPERLVGLHFFNPVPAGKLVEIVIGDRTSPALKDRAVSWVDQMNKTPVVVRNLPGFASSRLGVALGIEAIRMVEEGVASAGDIDAAMTLGYGHPSGPLRLTDLVGIDVRLGIARYLEQELGARFAPPQLMIDMVAEGKLGRKSGQGFYGWSEGPSDA